MSVPEGATTFRGLPSTDNPEKFLAAVKEVLETMMGHRGAETDRVVTVADLASGGMVRYLNDQAVSVTRPKEAVQPTEVPKAPRDLMLISESDGARINAFNHHLTWILPDDDTITATEVWVNAGSNSRSGAIFIASVPYDRAFYTNGDIDVTKHYYYWIRTVNWAGNYSTWEPTGSTAGYLVPKSGTIGETVDKLMDALKGEAPALYAGGTTYAVGDQVSYVGADTWTRNYRCIKASLGNAPTDTEYWERLGILTEGEIDGEATVGIDGNMVVDGTIVARNVAAAAITADKISTASLSAISANLGTITAGLARDAASEFQVDFNNKWLKVYDDADQLRVHIGYIA